MSDVMSIPITGASNKRDTAWAAIAGLVLSLGLIVFACLFFGGQAARQTASALAQAQATAIANAAAPVLSDGQGVARAPEDLNAATIPLAKLVPVQQMRVVDTLARTVTVLSPTAPVSRAAITDQQKPLFDYALKMRADTPAEGYGDATGFVSADGSGFGAQAVRAVGDDGVSAPVGMVDVQVTPPAYGGGPSLIALGLILLFALGGIFALLAKGAAVARFAPAIVAMAGIAAVWTTVKGAGRTITLSNDALGGLSQLLGGTPVQALQGAADVNALMITLSLLGIIGTALCFAFTSGAMGRLWDAIKTYRTAYAYIAPAIILLILLSFFPFFYGIAMSFTNTTLLNGSDAFVDRLNGLDNYAAILGDFNLRQPDTGVLNYQNFYWTAFMTVIWTVTNVFLGVSIGLGLALLLNIKGLQGVAIYRTLLILPWALPNYITALTWKGLFHPQFGAFNAVIQAFGGEPVKWFDTLWPAFFTGLATNAWLSFPFMMVVALGALQSIDQGMYEAAKIDGASPWQRFTMITLPSLKPALLPAIIVSVVWTFNMFNVIFLVSAGQPSGGTEILITRAYKVAFEEYRYGYAAAYSVVIFLILLIYGVFQVRATKATEANA